MNRSIRNLLLAAAAVAPLAACSDRVRYEDPEAVETIDPRFGSTDLQTIARELTDSFLATNAWTGERPRIVFGGVANRTKQHLDTQNITDTIRTSLVQSGKFRVLAGDQGIDEIAKETDYQQSGAVDRAAAVQLGMQLGAEYVFFGRFTEIAKEAGSVESRWMKFTLNAVDVQTREIVWADEVQISKIKDSSFLGW
ncbi:MAG TPA: penicillin-binding protein activator LpoB [Planctomycetota bacterium]